MEPCQLDKPILQVLIDSFRDWGRDRWLQSGKDKRAASGSSGTWKPAVSVRSQIHLFAYNYGYDRVFQRQIEALCCNWRCRSRDFNVWANEGFTAALTGESGGEIANIAAVTLRAASTDTERIQEGHIPSGNMLCDWVESSVTMQMGR